MTKLETTFGNVYKVKETPEKIAKLSAKSNFIHLTLPNGQSISINALHIKK